MFDSLIEYIKQLHKERNKYDRCYLQMKSSGHTFLKKCTGALGGTKATDYLSESCIGCPYLHLTKDGE